MLYSICRSDRCLCNFRFREFDFCNVLA